MVVNRQQAANLHVQVDCAPMAAHLVVTAMGSWTEDTFRHIVDLARMSATEHGLTRILLDMRAVSRPDTEYIRYIGGLYIATTIARRFRIAAVGESGNVTHYGETVARNRGSDFMAFSDEERATQWLLR